MLRCCLPILLFSLSVAPLSGALYEFTLRGHVTYSGFQNVFVGDEVVAHYTASDWDQQPDPAVGIYQVSPVTLEVPAGTLDVGPSSLPSLYVALRTGVDVLQYQDLGQVYYFNYALSLPDGTLADDSLPLTLPLKNSNSSNFSFGPGLFFLRFRGEFTEYSSRLIPEPGMVLPALVGLLFLIKRRPSVRDR